MRYFDARLLSWPPAGGQRDRLTTYCEGLLNNSEDGQAATAAGALMALGAPLERVDIRFVALLSALR